MMELGNLLLGHSRGLYAVERGEWQDEFYRLVEAVAEDSTGWFETFENAVFVIRPYWWGECDCEDAITAECRAHWPNFVFKPTGYELMWYKYPLRDSYANVDLSFEEFKSMVDACVSSLKGEGVDE